MTYIHMYKSFSILCCSCVKYEQNLCSEKSTRGGLKHIHLLSSGIGDKSKTGVISR